jgi:CPA1 family monovalent cation:H+ antiporter
MEPQIVQLELLLLLAALVAMACRRFRLPYSVGLVIAGMCLAFLPYQSDLKLSKELIFTVFLPPLVFEAALYIHWNELRRDLAVVLPLATLGVILAAVLTAVGMHYLVGWGWASAAIFGILISATDPVSVIATFKEAGVHGRLRLLVEAESLLNDGTAAVGFAIAIVLASGVAVTPVDVVSSLALTVLGGIVCGLAAGFGLMFIAGKTHDPLVEITLTTVAAYGSFMLAEHWHMSGVLATLVAGLVVGNHGKTGPISPKGRVAVESFWDYAAFIANSLIFILIGSREAEQNFAAVLLPAVIAVVLVTAGRAVAIYPICAFFVHSKLHVDIRHQHVLFWGGLRGALALALALGLPDALPHRDEIVTVAFAVVAFSIFVQGLTMTPLLRKLGQLHPKTGGH